MMESTIEQVLSSPGFIIRLATELKNEQTKRTNLEAHLIKKHRSDCNMPTQKSVQPGLFEIQKRPIKHNDGSTSISKTVRVTAKGQRYFINLFLGGR